MISTADSILHEISAIRDYIVAVQDVLATGRMPEMIGLEQRINDICQSVQMAPSEIQQKCLHDLKVLLSDIDACKYALKSFHSSYLDEERSSND